MTTGSPYEALTELAWRQLLAQSVLLQTVAGRLADFHDAALTSGAAHMALASLPLMCGSAATTAASDEQAVAEAASLWSAQLDQAIAAGTGDPNLALLESVRTQLSTFSVANHFARLFSEVSSRAAGVYGDQWIPPRLELGWVALHPRPGNDPYAFEALTKSGPPPVVELIIHPDGFGPAAYSALPYVLLHEAICHVPSRPLGEASNSSSFAEGFMDSAAHFFLDAWMAAIDPALAPAALEHAHRMDPVITDASTPSGAARLRGRRAARRLVAWLMTEGGASLLEAQTAIAELARDLNCVDRSLVFKDAFVAAANDEPWPPDFQTRLLAVVESGAPGETLL